MSAFPPQYQRPSQAIGPDAALEILQNYLARAETTPYLLPNATLTPTGPTAQDASSNLTIHNLKRVEAGLKGEWLAPTLELDGHVAGAQEEIDPFAVADAEEAKEKEMQAEGWQDLDDYQKDQSDIEGEIGDRVQNAVDVQGADEDADPMEVEIEHNTVTPAKKPSKEERKAAKALRSKMEKKQRAKALQG